MTQISTSEPTPDAPAMFPPDRYGRRREPQHRPRWVLPVLVLAIVTVMLLIAVKLYFEYGNDEFTPNVISSTNITDTSITVTFEVTKSDGKAATCTVQAFSDNGTQVGQHQVPVPVGDDVSVTYRLATTARAYTAEVPTCQPAA